MGLHSSHIINNPDSQVVHFPGRTKETVDEVTGGKSYLDRKVCGIFIAP